MKNYLLGLLVILMVSCGKSDYKITQEKSNDNLSKCNINIELKSKVNKQRLNEIANEIRSSRRKYNDLYVFYYVKGMNENSGAWATSHFTPTLEIQILGATEEEDEMLDNVSIESGEQIGKWKEEDAMMSATYILFKENKELRLKMTFMDGSGMTINVKKSKYNGKVRYDYKDENKNDFFIIESNGNFGIYDADGKISEAKKIE